MASDGVLMLLEHHGQVILLPNISNAKILIFLHFIPMHSILNTSESFWQDETADVPGCTFPPNHHIYLESRAYI